MPWLNSGVNMKLPKELEGKLLWCESAGYGWHSSEPMEYTGDYFKSYIERDNTPMGKALTEARVNFVREHYDGNIVDIGIGGGRFALEIGGLGCDVSESAIEWLQSKGLYWDPFSQKTPAVTCWDSLEHMPDPGALLRNVEKWCFVSMPIYDTLQHCLNSKHYKPPEHLFYFTEDGLKRFMGEHGFECVAVSDIESELGREDIVSFAFRRVR